jgi:hypothetical protein
MTLFMKATIPGTHGSFKVRTFDQSQRNLFPRLKQKDVATDKRQARTKKTNAEVNPIKEILPLDLHS